MSTPEQPNLPMDLPEPDWDAVEGTEGTYTVERLQIHHPRIFAAIVELLGCEVPIKTIARVLHCHIKTVMAVRAKAAEPIATVKNRLSTRLMGLGELQSEIAEDSLADILKSGTKLSVKDLKDLLIGMGIVLEKGLLTGGEATSRIAITKGEPDHDDFNRLVKDITADVSTHSPGETPAQKTAPLALPAGSGATLDVPGSAQVARDVTRPSEDKASPATGDKGGTADA